MEALVREAQEDFRPDSYRDHVATMDKTGKRVWIYPQKPKGKLFNARAIVAGVLLTMLFTLPFVKVNGEPLFLLNVVERKFIIFGYIFWPQDFFLFGLAMLTFMVFIVLFTVVFGRLWCGWACPQTIFMEMVFRRVEYWIEGDAAHQKALNKMPWNTEKILKKTAKLSLFFVISFIIANTFLSYIIGIDKLFSFAAEPSAHVGGLISLLVFTGIFFSVFAWFREQACIVVCPYGRLQGVLLVKESIVVAYDYIRGEPRGKFKKNAPKATGDCIDCRQCVKVCPTGIDIRHGTQLECVNCTACIDACNFMMRSVGREEGLIRLASEKSIAEKQPFKITARIAGYIAVLCVLVTILGFALYNRSDVETTILRTPGMLYQEQGEDKVSNLYNIKIVNKTHDSIPAVLRIEGMKGEIKMVGKSVIGVEKGEMGESEFFVVLDRSEIKNRKTKVKIGVYSGDKKLETVETTFMGPVKKK